MVFVLSAQRTLFIALIIIIIIIIIIQWISRGSELPEKRKKTPDPPGLEPGILLVMSNALTTELWDQAEPRRRRQVFHSRLIH